MYDNIYATNSSRAKIKKQKPLQCTHYTTLKQIKSKLSIVAIKDEHVVAVNEKGLTTIYQKCDNGLYKTIN